jgi:succinate-acetate transporter protein
MDGYPIPGYYMTDGNTIANPAPLGLGAFALTTVVLSCFNAGFITSGAAVVVPLAMAYGGTGQFLAGMWEFKKGNTFGATAFSSFGAFWWFYALLHWTVPGEELSAEALAVTLAAWGVFTFYMWIGSFGLTKAVWLVFLTLWITFFLLSAGEFVDIVGEIGGYIGLFCGVTAWYTSAAIAVNDTLGKPVLPLGSPFIHS